ncbi:hypothetical protein T439DRAFT_53703 [Meredithblackwellia eburnea MCA 4105]
MVFLQLFNFASLVAFFLHVSSCVPWLGISHESSSVHHSKLVASRSSSGNPTRKSPRQHPNTMRALPSKTGTMTLTQPSQNDSLSTFWSLVSNANSSLTARRDWRKKKTHSAARFPLRKATSACIWIVFVMIRVKVRPVRPPIPRGVELGGMMKRVWSLFQLGRLLWHYQIDIRGPNAFQMCWDSTVAHDPKSKRKPRREDVDLNDSTVKPELANSNFVGFVKLSNSLGVTTFQGFSRIVKCGGYKPYIAHIAFLAFYTVDALGFTYLPNKDNNRMDISHLCHNMFCFNPDHVVGEAHKYNIERNECKIYHMGDKYDPDYVCPHGDGVTIPRCILKKPAIAPRYPEGYCKENNAPACKNLSFDIEDKRAINRHEKYTTLCRALGIRSIFDAEDGLRQTPTPEQYRVAHEELKRRLAESEE